MSRLVLLSSAMGALMALSGPVAATPEVGQNRPEWCAKGTEARSSVAPAPFAKLADKLAHGEALKLVAVGSSSTEGSDLPDRRMAYPTHLETELNARFGSASFTVVNKGKGGETIADVVARFERDVIAEKPDLVVWQLGTNDIVKQVDMEGARRGVVDGLSRLNALGIAVVLMDSQTSPRVLASPAREPIESMIRDEARRVNAMVWSRFGLMQSIVADGKASAEQLISADGLHMSVPMHQCTGAVLAEAIGSQLAPQASDQVASVLPRR